MRLLLVQTGNGTILERWRSNGSGEAFRSGRALPRLEGPILGELERHRRELLLLDGIDLSACYDGRDGWPPGPNHGHAGASVLWTGVNGGGRGFGGDAGEWPTGPSVDQVIADHVSAGTAHHSLQLGVWRRPVDPRGVHSFSEGGVALVPELDPRAVYGRVFAGVERTQTPAPEAGPTRRVERRRRSLALLRGEIGRLRAQVPREDRERFERHLAGIDALEERLDALPGSGAAAAACAPSARPGSDSGSPEAADAQLDIIKNAFACDLTRVVSFTLTPENVWQPQNFIDGWDRGLGESHAVSHLTTDPDRGTARRAIDNCTALSRWHARKLAELIDALKSVEEGPGETLFDNTVVVWGMAMSQGGYHTNRSVPFVVAHGRNGPFRLDRYLRWGEYEQPATGGCPGSRRCHQSGGGESNNRLLVSLCHAFGLRDVDSFGDRRWTGPLPELV